jgi:DNA-binding response OmpR family regulator
VICVIDDEEVIAAAIGARLRAEGYDVSVCAS